MKEITEKDVLRFLRMRTGCGVHTAKVELDTLCSKLSSIDHILVNRKNQTTKKNFEFEHEGEKYWYSRSVAAAVALIAFRDNIPHLLIVQRGPNATHPGKWCIPGGFLEHNEYIYDCAHRELFEETGISLQPSNDEDPLTIVGIIDDPKTSTKQNVVFVYKIIRGNAMDEELSLANAEPGEISDAKWIPISDFDSIDWAFNKSYNSELRKLLNHYIK